MARTMRVRAARAIRCAVGAAIVTAAGAPQAAAADDNIVWTNASGDRQYSNPANWDPNFVPLNPPPFYVLIPGGSNFVVEQNGVVGQVSRLTLGSDARIKAMAGTDFTTLSLPDPTTGFYDASAGGRFTALGAGVPYSSAGYAGGALIMGADGAGSQLRLSPLSSLDAGFDDGWFEQRIHEVRAGAGGTVDLSGVQWARGPVRGEDGLWMHAVSGGVLDLSGLKTTGSAGTGWVALDAEGSGTTLSLPAVTGLSNTFLAAVGGGQVVAEGAAAATYSTAGYPGGALVMRTEGAGSKLRLRALSSLDAGFDDGWFEQRIHEVRAGAGGTVDLSGVQWARGPVRGEDGLVLKAEGGLLNLGGLRRVTSSGGFVRAEVSAGGELRLGDVRPAIDFPVTLAGPGDTLRPAGSLTLGPGLTLTSGAGGVVRSARDLYNLHTVEENVQLSSAIVRTEGSGLQELEIGGFDVGTDVPRLPNDNFGFGRLIVGQAGQATVVSIREDAPNGNRLGAVPEAHYLFGVRGRTGAHQAGDPDALEILGGSTLLIRNLNVYARQGGSMFSLQSLFTGTEIGHDRIKPYDDGYVSRSFSALPGAWDKDGDGDWSPAANWFMGKPDGVGMTAIFGDKISAPVTVNVNVPATVGLLGFDNAHAYTIQGAAITLSNAGGIRGGIQVENAAGDGDHVIKSKLVLVGGADLRNRSTGTLRIEGELDNAGGGEVIKSGPGLVVIAGPQAHGPGARIQVDEGTLRLLTDAGSLASRHAKLEAGGGVTELNVSQHLGNVEVLGGVVRLAEGQRLIRARSLEVTGGLLDLADGDMILDGEGQDVHAVRRMIRAGYGTGTWDGGSGVVTSLTTPPAGSPAPVMGKMAALGYAQASAAGTFAGEAVAAGDVLVKYTLEADANLDGDVDLLDVLVWGPNFTGELGGDGDKTWGQGDWDYDGDVDLLDVLKWGPNFTGELGGGGLAISVPFPLHPDAAAWYASAGIDVNVVPEPAAMGLLAAAAVGLLCRRRRRGSRCVR